LFRDKWNMFKGFPINSARLCYIFMLNKCKGTDQPMGSSGAQADENSNGVTVSTLEE
jgi:hypothetical protein